MTINLFAFDPCRLHYSALSTINNSDNPNPNPNLNLKIRQIIPGLPVYGKL